MIEKAEPKFVVDEPLEGSLRYTEAIEESNKGTLRKCSLWIPDESEPVSSMALYAFDQRFGATAISVEGIGDVNTNPEYRRRGYITKLMHTALRGAASRVDALFLFGISGLYENFGFTSCLAGSKFTIWLRNTRDLKRPENLHARAMTQADLPAFLSLFNSRNTARPWTRVRDDRASPRIFRKKSWRPAPECILLESRDSLHAYALVAGHGYGWGRETHKVQETAADSPESARALISVLRDRSMERWEDTLTIEGPSDSDVGRTIRQIGGTLHRNYASDGGGMGLITNRASLVGKLSGELERRTGGTPAPSGAYQDLTSGTLVPDNGLFLKLLVGFWSWEDAEHAGLTAADSHGDILRAWFPGGGASRLPEPFAYGLDEY